MLYEVITSIEVAPVPKLCRRHVFTHAAHRVEMLRETIPAGVLNAPPLLAEINDKIAEYRPGAENHVINLTLLPQTEEDLVITSYSIHYTKLYEQCIHYRKMKFLIYMTLKKIIITTLFWTLWIKIPKKFLI